MNSHYPVALWVMERIRPGGILPFQSLERWGNEKKVAEFQFVDDPRVEQVSGEIERSLFGPRGVLRLAGLSGLGKTRLAFEALRSCHKLSSAALSTRMAASVPSTFWEWCRPFESSESLRSS